MAPFARASSLDRLLACPGPLVLPNEESPAGEAALYGTAYHHWVETGRIPRGKYGERVAKKLTACGIVRTRWWPEGGHHEVALAWNVVKRTSAVTFDLSKDDTKEWRDSFDDEWITGSADYAGDMFGTPWVDDAKTGRDGTWAKYKAQQTFYTLVWAHHRAGELAGGVSTITHHPYYRLAELPRRNEAKLDVADMQKFTIELADLRKRVLEARKSGTLPVLTPGSHCEWCPSHKTCPAQGNV